MLYDFKVNLIIAYPMFLISSYFLISAGLDPYHNPNTLSESQRNSEIIRLMLHAFNQGTVVIISNYIV